MKTRRTALTLLMLSAVAILVAGSFTWATASVFVLGGAGTRELTVSGNAAVPAVMSLAVVALAAALALLALKGWTRQLIGVLVVVIAVAIEVAVIRFVAEPTIDSGNDSVSSVGLSPWWILVILLALVMLMSGGLIIGFSRSWSALGSKYEAEGVRKEATLSPWDALNAGLDPTQQPADPTSGNEPA